MVRFGLILAALVAPGTAMAANQVTLDSNVFVERSVSGADGKAHLVRVAPKPVFPGDKLLFVLSYRNQGVKPAEDFTVTNPIPGSVSFVSNEGDAEYSVDGGRSWGHLTMLKVKRSDGSLRTAQPDDVTHVRWTLARPIPVGGSGSLSFHGLVK
jgi:uncharacterized repeat protein (TIGR01451 family)